MKQEKLLELTDVPTLGEFCSMSDAGILEWIGKFQPSAIALGLVVADDSDCAYLRGITQKGLGSICVGLNQRQIGSLKSALQYLTPIEGDSVEIWDELLGKPLNVVKYQILNSIPLQTEGEAFDPSPLVEFIEEILADEEVSSEEAYSLADYLNNDRASCDNWPGNELVPILQEIWSDGEAQPEELHHLADKLLDIVHQYSNSRVGTVDLGQSAFGDLDENEALMPSLPVSIQVESESDRGAFYTVDLAVTECSCPDWHSRRSKLPKRHLSRCCKHVIMAYRSHKPVGGWPSWIGAFCEHGWTPHPRSEWKVIWVDEQPVLISNAPRGWNDVYAPKGDDYGRFGFNASETRWAYADTPEGAIEILTELHHF